MILTTKITTRAPVSGDGQQLLQYQPTSVILKEWVANKATTQFVVSVSQNVTKLKCTQVGKKKKLHYVVTSIEEFNVVMFIIISWRHQLWINMLQRVVNFA